jgi:hypothetical protein
MSIIAVTNKHTAKLHHVGYLYNLTYDARKTKHKKLLSVFVFLASHRQFHSFFSVFNTVITFQVPMYILSFRIRLDRADRLRFICLLSFC